MGFMVSVDGMRAPKYVHATIDDAITEAMRIQQLSVEQRGWCQPVRITEEVMTLPSVQRNGLMNLDELDIIRNSVQVKIDTMVQLFRRCVKS
jgi:hypothetical protein